MSQVSIFDIVGPIMVGPSSSHTAGAVRLGFAGRKILAERVRRADIYLHGSFAATYWGHRTDIALLAGLLDMGMADPRIPQARAMAAEQGLVFQFQAADLGDVHPNSVRLQLRGDHGVVDMQGASIGGGRISIFALDGFSISCDGSYVTLICQHWDEPGIISEITRVLANMDINIAFLEVSRRRRGREAMLVAQTDDPLSDTVLREVAAVRGVKHVRCLPRF